jgi:hypothetical protein
MKMWNKISSLLVVVVLILFSCNDQSGDQEKVNASKVEFIFEHYVGDSKLIFDEMNYTNAGGNDYEVTEIQYFVSDITLNKVDGDKIVLDGEKFAHYIDTNIPETFSWKVTDNIPAGEYKSISMTFGIKGEKNKPFMFTDPPESDMLWPINLGGDEGGYHYMKLNGFWMNQEGQREPFNFHLGVGQERDDENNIVGFIQNWFEEELPSSSFTITEGEEKQIAIRMDVDEWWKNPNIYDHDFHGGKIMQNQDAMRMGVENGKSVFKVSKISTTLETM